MSVDTDWEFKAKHWEREAKRLITENNSLKSELLLLEGKPTFKESADRLAKIAQRLIKWDTDFPVNCDNGYAGLQELNKIIADAKKALLESGLKVPDDL